MVPVFARAYLLKSFNRMLIRWRELISSALIAFPDAMRSRTICSGCSFRLEAFVVFALLYLVGLGDASSGDQGSAYQSCLQKCLGSNCSTAPLREYFRSQRPWYLEALNWDCLDECRYGCMWRALEFFQRVGKPIPQFHGKWPFLRLYGIQEPASALFSVLNGLSHACMWHRFSQRVPPTAPNYLIWKGQALLSINAWFWSTVFHARDTPLTEKLDYFCAFSLVLYSLYSLCMRVLGTDSALSAVTVTVPFVAFFAYHIHYLAFVHFDYGYNMRANVVAGLLNSVGWLWWCWNERGRRPYVWRCAAVVLALNALLLLELGDFPPWHYVLDAHALWHLGTAPLPLLWYRFLTDDTLYELNATKARRREKPYGGSTPCLSCESRRVCRASADPASEREACGEHTRVNCVR